VETTSTLILWQFPAAQRSGSRSLRVAASWPSLTKLGPSRVMSRAGMAAQGWVARLLRPGLSRLVAVNPAADHRSFAGQMAGRK